MSAQRPLVLVVDDHQAILDLLSFRLQHAGYATLATTDAREVVAIARESTPNVILLDYHMPDMDGACVVAALRACPETRDTAVVMLSGDDPAVLRQSICNACVFLTKPYHHDKLLEVLARLTGAPCCQ